MKKIIIATLVLVLFFSVDVEFSPKISTHSLPSESKDKTFIESTFSFFSLGGVVAYSQGKKKRKRRRARGKSKEIDVSDIAEKYWRPQRDKLGVIQGRRFKKSKHLEASLIYGFYQSRQYTDSNSYGLSLVYNISESWGLDFSYMGIQNSNSTFYEDIRKRFPNIDPGFNLEKSQSILALTWSPIYAKFAFLGKKISHFETYLSLGAGFTETKKRHFTYSVAVGERFYLSKNLLFRLEWRISRYTDNDIVGQDVDGGETVFSDSPTRANLILGLGWLF